MADSATDTDNSSTPEAPAKCGAPAGNVNALRNGARATIARLPLSLLPKTLRRQESNARAFRAELEAAVQRMRGEVTLLDASLINEAAQAEVHASICAWLLRSRLESMSVADVVTCSREILRSKDVRHRAMSRLKLDRTATDAITALYDATTQPEASEGEVP